MQKFILILLVLFSTAIQAQNNSKTYKYAIVPLQYNFLSKPNQFQLNVLTRVKLKEAGFKVYMDEGEKMPIELSENNCMALKANVIKEKGIFTSNLLFQLRNCYGNVVFESRGSSREKAYEVAYKEALTIALDEFLFISSKYVNTSYEKPEETTKMTIEETESDDTPFSQRAVKYSFEGKTLWLLKKGDNYTLFEDEGITVFATLSQADRGTFSYDSSDIDGAAYFNPNGDMIVEYLAKDKVEVQKIVFKKL